MGGRDGWWLLRHLEKGGSLLQEAASAADTEASVRELAAALHLHLTQFTERLHHTRDRLEDTARCYHLLDKFDKISKVFTGETLQRTRLIISVDFDNSRVPGVTAMVWPPMAAPTSSLLPSRLWPRPTSSLPLHPQDPDSPSRPQSPSPPRHFLPTLGHTPLVSPRGGENTGAFLESELAAGRPLFRGGRRRRDASCQRPTEPFMRPCTRRRPTRLPLLV
ncbi:hypothetical protein E2C01_009637 [Portunus trituberculatus]|uniref:Uncharacterized protein n=1 Tax=Portunus trituberculatus TaxID=210409 RepID=A0A5B7D6A3_PORTR|nr:hypothetical protein [Portunus trituberculatus]